MFSSRMFLVALVALVLFAMSTVTWATEQEFHLARPDAASVALAGEFNHWQAQPMAKQAGGLWSLTISLPAGTYGYKFLVNGSEWLFDPGNPARKTVDGIENSSVQVSNSGKESAASLGSIQPPVAPVVTPPIARTTPSVAPSPDSLSLASTPRPSLAPVPGETLVAEVKLSPANRQLAIKAGASALTTARVTLVVPPGFDPAKSWPILVINNTENYANDDAMKQFVEPAIAEGWIVLGADPIDSERDPKGGWRAACSVAGLDYLAAVWPGAERWPVACGGMSGGAKNSGEVAAEVAKAHYHLIGMLMLGCNQDLASVALRKVSPPQFLQVPIYLGSGKADTIATPTQTGRVKESMRHTGFRKLRLESHDGAHVVAAPQVGEALRWFMAEASPGTKAAKSSAFDSFFKKP